MNNKTALTIVIIVLLLIGGWLLLANDNGDVGEDAAFEAQLEELRESGESGVITRNNVVAAGSSTITVDAASFNNPGFIVVTAEGGEIIGTSELLTGFHENVEITLERPVQTDETVRIVLYGDIDNDGQFTIESDQLLTNIGTAAEVVLVVEGEGDGTATTTNDGDEQTQAETRTIIYTDAGFEPGTITVSQGDTVVWQNNSSVQMWVASAIHPTHTAYPGSNIEKCGTTEEGNFFDQCGAVSAGSEYSFTFDQEGEWGFHNHLNANHTGTVIVE